MTRRRALHIICKNTGGPTGRARRPHAARTHRNERARRADERAAAAAPVHAGRRAGGGAPVQQRAAQPARAAPALSVHGGGRARLDRPARGAHRRGACLRVRRHGPGERRAVRLRRAHRLRRGQPPRRGGLLARRAVLGPRLCDRGARRAARVRVHDARAEPGRRKALRLQPRLRPRDGKMRHAPRGRAARVHPQKRRV